MTCIQGKTFYDSTMIKSLIRLVVLGLVVGFTHATMAGCGSCGGCGSDDGAKKKKDTNNVTPSDKK